jgi:phytoene dehydrogenase-like protein
VLHMQFTPYHLREGRWKDMHDPIADRAIAIVDRHIPGFAARIRARTVLTPPDLEAHFGLREGAVSQGAMMLDQILFMRPVAGASRYAMPVDGLYLCGAGTHPGGGMTGLSGRLAAHAVLARRRHARSR